MPKYNLGSKLNQPVHSPFSDEKEHVIFPSLSLNAKEFPPVKDWKPGETYDMKIKVKMTGMHVDGKSTSGEFDIIEAENA